MTSKIPSFILCGLFASVLLSSPAHAAVVQSVEGQVQINRGNGFERITGAVNAQPGDRVMVSPQGSAELVYPDGCVANIRAGSVVSVRTQSPCTAQHLVEGQPDQKNYGLLPLGIGTAAAFTAFCLSSACGGDDNRDRQASP